MITKMTNKENKQILNELIIINLRLRYLLFILIIIFCAIIFSPKVSALYSGESTIIYSGTENITSYSVMGNTSALTINQLNDSVVNVTIPGDYDINGTITITFNGWSHKDVLEPTFSGGSGGSYNPDWNKNKTVIKNDTKPLIIINDTKDNNIDTTPEPTEDNHLWIYGIVLTAIFLGLVYYIIKSKNKEVSNQ